MITLAEDCFGIIFEIQPEKRLKMKKLLAIFCIVFTASLANAQPPTYDDLKVLYADANYEKLAKVASGYTEKDKTKKDILPYIWLSKGLYKISLSGTSDERFKNAYKDAIKYLKKGLKYDIKYNEGATFEEHREFLDEFQASLVEVIDNEVSAGNYRKSYGWVIKYNSITVNAVGPKFMMGACKFQDQDKPSARTFWQEGNAMLEEIESIDSWSEADKLMLKLGVLHSAAAMKKGRQEEKAQQLVNKVAQWFEDDENWQERYDEIVNSGS